MNRFTPIIASFRSMPRAGQWLAYLGILCAVFFAIVQPVVDALLSINGRADGALRELARHSAAGQARQQADAAVRAGTAALGVVAFPGDEAQRSEAFNRAINEVLARHHVVGGRISTRRAPLAASPLDAVAGEGRRVDRLIMDLQFDGTPEQVSAVISDLESTPEIAAVSRIHLRREAGGDGGRALARTVRANLSAEAWLLARKDAAR